MAERTGGRHFRATDADALVDVYREIDGLERTRIVEDRMRQFDEYYGPPLAAGLLLTVLAWLLRASVFARSP